MLISLKIGTTVYRAKLERPISIALKLGSQSKVNCYYAPPFKAVPFEEDGFIGSTKKGGPVNFFNLNINPHGNGTHTECVGHIAVKKYSIVNCLKKYHFSARLITVKPKKNGKDQVIGLKELNFLKSLPSTEAIIIRTTPNTTAKKTKNYSGTNPPYIDAKAISLLNQLGVEHLLIDLPSVDKEKDGGKLAGHKTFWNYPRKPKLNKTITELVYVPNNIKDGLYLLNLQIAALDLDASPSQPIIYSLEAFD